MKSNAPAIPALREETSRQIVVCRVVCIFFMMSVHVSPGFDAGAWGFGDAMHWIGGLWVEVLGRSSVPTLSVVSGFLIALQFGREGAGRFAWKRFRVLCVPMLFWNALLGLLVLLPVLASGYQTATYAMFFDGPLWRVIAENFLFLSGFPANPPLAFLRDLFVCSLVAFLLLRLAAWALWPYLIAALVLAAMGWNGWVILRPSILACVMAGALLQRGAGHLTPPAWLRPLSWGALLIAVLFVWLGGSTSSDAGVPREIKRLVLQLIAMACTLDAAAMLARGGAFRLLRGFEPAAYLAYLSHSIVISVAWEVHEAAIGGVTSPLYPLFFLAMPPAVFLLARAAGPLIGRLPGGLQVLLRGKARGHANHTVATMPT